MRCFKIVAVGCILAILTVLVGDFIVFYGRADCHRIDYGQYVSAAASGVWLKLDDNPDLPVEDALTMVLEDLMAGDGGRSEILQDIVLYYNKNYDEWMKRGVDSGQKIVLMSGKPNLTGPDSVYSATTANGTNISLTKEEFHRQRGLLSLMQQK